MHLQQGGAHPHGRLVSLNLAGSARTESLPGDGLVAEALIRQQLVQSALVLEDGAEVVVAAGARRQTVEGRTGRGRHEGK